MIELPEAAVIAEQINGTVNGKRVMNVIAAKSPHKFAWYHGDPQKYHDLIKGKVIGKAALADIKPSLAKTLQTSPVLYAVL